MTDPAGPAAPAPRLLALLQRVARWAAMAGGLLLCALAALTLTSIAGRSLLARPILGDIELVEMGVATAVFLFLPYGHLSGANVAVEIFTNRLPASLREALARLGDLLLGAIAALLAWRMALGGLEARRYGEETMMLGLPIWWAFVPGVAALVLLALCCLATLRYGRGGEAGSAA